jgi:hypothetical protein
MTELEQKWGKLATDATPEMEYGKYKSWVLTHATRDLPKYLKEHEEAFKKSIADGKSKWSVYVGEIRQLELSLDRALKQFVGDPDL